MFLGNKLKSSNQAGRDLFEEENDPSKCILVRTSSFAKNFEFVLDLQQASKINMFLGLEKHLEDAQKRKEQEQADYIQRMVSSVSWYLARVFCQILAAVKTIS